MSLNWKLGFPPVDLFHDPATGDYYIGDGNHRVLAAIRLSYPNKIAAHVHRGGRDAALEFALRANAYHGMSRTSKDGKKTLALACRFFPNASNRDLAAKCAVGEAFVRAFRATCAHYAPALARISHTAFLGPSRGGDFRVHRLPIAFVPDLRRDLQVFRAISYCFRLVPPLFSSF